MGSRPSSFTFTTPGAFRIYSTPELLTLPPPNWLVEGVMPEGGLCGLYGPPESLKSFVAIDLALSVATGLPWHGHPVQRGFVLYVAAEGGPGISKRVRAWLTAKGIKASDAQVGWLIEAISMHKESGDLDILMHRIEHEVDRQPRLIIIDTLARCFDGDENLQEDMGRFVAGLDRLRHEYGATLLVIHHSRLDGERERGSTSFRGGVDTMMKVARTNETLLIECDKQKDAEHFSPIDLELQVVPDTDSCILISEEEAKNARTLRLLAYLRKKGPLSRKDWQVQSGVPKTSFGRCILDLQESGQIIKENGIWQVFTP